MFSVLHLSFESDFRGSENQMFLLHEKLLQAGVRSMVLTLAGGSCARYADKEKIPQVYSVKKSPFAFGELDPWLISATLEAARRLGPDILHARGSRSCGILFFAKWLLPSSIKVVFHRTVSNPIGLASKWKYNAADRVLVVCKAIEEHLSRKGVDSRKIRVIPSGIPMGDCCKDNQNQMSYPKESLKKQERASLFTIGSLSALDRYQKDVAALLEAGALLKKQRVKARFLIFGDGPDRSRLEGMTRELGLEPFVEFKGWWSGPMHDALAQMDLFVLPSLQEGTSNVLISAMAAGLPCIATGVGGNPEVLGDAGILVPPGDPKVLAKAILDLIENSNLRNDLKNKAKNRALLFSLENTVQKTIACYQELVG